jgi:glucuronokinase
VHNDLRFRWDEGDQKVHEAMGRFADLTDRFRDALESSDYREIDELINANFDLRRSIMNLSRENVEMVETARAAGCSAKFTGSGGAIIGAYADEAAFQTLSKALKKIDVEVMKPEIVYPA